MKNINVYSLLVEAKVNDNINTTKKQFNSILSDIKEEKELFETQFSVINEDHNIDTSDIKKGFNKAAKSLKEAKALIEESEDNKKKGNLKVANDLIKKAHKHLKSTKKLSERNTSSFHSVVTIAESLESSKQKV